MSSRCVTPKLIMVICATLMLAAQILGLHFHRDAGLHADEIGHHTMLHGTADQASHPGEDVEIDPLAGGLAKFIKVWLFAGFPLVALLWLVHAPRPTLPAFARAGPRPHPAHFVLHPPSHAPPLQLVLVR
jgi:hypothetical protein